MTQDIYTTPEKQNTNDIDNLDIWLQANDDLLLHVNPDLKSIYDSIDYERMR